LPFCHVHLKAQKPQKWQLLDPPKTMGDHLRKRRLQLGWGATRLGALLKVSKDTIYNWEHNRSNPAIRFMPRIVDFLGYDPTNSAATYWAKGLGNTGPRMA
jgi:transcriptional regulator with XRE-family HTH domain